MRDLTPLVALAPGEHETVAVRSPSTGELLVNLPMAATSDLDYALTIARSAQAAWRDVPVKQRARVLRRFRHLLLDRAEDILDVIQLETGKARRHAFEELADVAFVCSYYGHVAPRLLASRRTRGAVPALTRTCVVRHPRGVVGVISPWNYPLVLAVSDSLPAVVAGNAVVVKPDVQTTHTALAALELLLEAGLPAGVFQVLPGDGPVAGAGLVDRVDYVSFTGSTETGRLVAQRAGARLIGCSLELGGKNPMIVREDAELLKAVDGAIRGSFANAGQLCISIERLYVHESVFATFLQHFVASSKALQLGASLDYETDMGSLTYDHQLRKVEDHVEDAVEKGAVVHAGGNARPDIGPLFYEPTVLTGVTSDMTIFAEETFGPVVSVYSFSSDEEAIQLWPTTRATVSTRVSGQPTAVSPRVWPSEYEAGTVNINEAYTAAWGSVDAPMGGRKDSGTGRRHGAEGLLKFTESQTIAVQTGTALDLSAPWLRKARRSSGPADGSEEIQGRLAPRLTEARC